MRRLATVLILATACLATSAAEDPATIVAKLAPSAGWAAPEPARTATHDTLFDLIDGGAELYHEYGVNRAVSWSLAGPSGRSIQVELYEMTDAPAAFGVLSLMQTGKYTRGELGQGSLRTNYYVAFWSGPYFANVTGAQPDTDTQAEVDRLAAALAALLPRNSYPPAWSVTAIPEDPACVKYFRGRIGLSNIPLGEVTELFDSHEGLVATYPGCRVLLLHFTTPDEAIAQLAAAAIRATARKSLTL